VIHGIKGTSLIDYPSKVATVLYTSRCNFRCPFCHNRELVLAADSDQIPLDEVLATLAERRGFIDGVVITGGEPTVHAGLGELIGAIKELGLAVKLDTNGYNSQVLQRLLHNGKLDFIAMDIKSSLAKYSRAAGIEVDTSRISRSIKLIKESGIGYEFRTTCVPSLVDIEDIQEISRLAGSRSRLTLQQFQPINTLAPEYADITPYPDDVLAGLAEIARRNVASCRLVGATTPAG
jgi:pyruvate formate lyase activating enzyme